MSGAAGKRHQSGKNTARSNLMTSILEAMNKEAVLDANIYQQADQEEKFNLLSNAISTVEKRFAQVHNIVNNATYGLDPRTTDCEERVLHLSEENQQLRFELDILKGLLAKAAKENQILREKVTLLSAQSMKANLVIGGLTATDEESENAKEVVGEFLHETMNLDFPSNQIICARHIGHFNSKSLSTPHLMVVTFQPNLRELILSNLHNLKGKKNANGKGYRINKQLPDQ